MRQSRKRGVIAVAAAGLLMLVPSIASGTGTTEPGDESAATEPAGTEPAGTEPAGTTAGSSGGLTAACGPIGVTDQADRSQGRPIAACDPGFPEPQPLAEPTTIQLTAATQGEYLAPVLLANYFGEFEKENLTVEIVQMPFADAMAQLAAGGADAANGGPFASFTNGVGSGLDLRWVLSNYSPTDGGDLSVPQAGLWVRRDAFSDPENPDIAELAGESIANSLGSGTVAVYWMGDAMEAAGASLADVTFEAIQPADQFQAMEGGAVVGAFMLDPFWAEVAANPDDYALLAVQPAEPNGGIFFGPSLLNDDPEAGAAFTRAYLRTISTYLQPGYQDNEEVVNALAETIPTEAQAIIDTPELTFEWEVREGLMDDLQRWYIELEAQTVDAMPEDQLVDRSFYLDAVGATG